MRNAEGRLVSDSVSLQLVVRGGVGVVCWCGVLVWCVCKLVSFAISKKCTLVSVSVSLQVGEVVRWWCGVLVGSP